MTNLSDRARKQGSQEQKLQELDHLLKWIKFNHPELVEEAEQPLQQHRRRLLAQVGEALLSLVVAMPKDFHGTAIVSRKLKRDSFYTATLVSISSGLNFLTNTSLFIYAFQNAGLFTVPLALLLNGGIMKYTNSTATVASARAKGNLTWSIVGVGGMAIMNLFQSAIAGVGIELLMNQSGLSRIKATQLIEKHDAKVESLEKPNNSQYNRYLELKQKCREGRQKLNNIQPSNPNYDRIHIQILGRHTEKPRDWSNVPLENLPICPKKDRLRRLAYEQYDKTKKEWERKISDRLEIGNDLLFLKRKMPEMYKAHFTEEQKIASGVEATRIAIISFLRKVKEGDLAGLGLSWLFLALSILTSTVACVLTIYHSRRVDTRQSFSKKVLAARDRALENYRRALPQRHAGKAKDSFSTIEVNHSDDSQQQN